MNASALTMRKLFAASGVPKKRGDDGQAAMHTVRRRAASTLKPEKAELPYWIRTSLSVVSSAGSGSDASPSPMRYLMFVDLPVSQSVSPSDRTS